jgi:hypothetical protein
VREAYGNCNVAPETSISGIRNAADFCRLGIEPSADKTHRLFDLVASSDGCLSDIDGTAEAHYMKRLSRAKARDYEEHYGRCDRCALALKEIDTFVRALTVLTRTMGNGDTNVN